MKHSRNHLKQTQIQRQEQRSHFPQQGENRTVAISQHKNIFLVIIWRDSSIPKCLFDEASSLSQGLQLPGDLDLNRFHFTAK